MSYYSISRKVHLIIIELDFGLLDIESSFVNSDMKALLYSLSVLDSLSFIQTL